MEAGDTRTDAGRPVTPRRQNQPIRSRARRCAGHKVRDNHDDQKPLGQTRRYLRDFIRLDQATDTLRQLFGAMIELYPDRANPGSLWGGANAPGRCQRFRGGPDPSMVRDQEQQFPARSGVVSIIGVLPVKLFGRDQGRPCLATPGPRPGSPKDWKGRQRWAPRRARPRCSRHVSEPR
jgi:hypothetical protein